MFLVGITGGIATGKTLACDFFKKKKIEIVDADQICPEGSISLLEKEWLGVQLSCDCREAKWTTKRRSIVHYGRRCGKNET